MSEKRLVRTMGNCVVGGVCGGIAKYFGIDVVVPRIIFLLFLVVFGGGLLAYIICWIAMPRDQD